MPPTLVIDLPTVPSLAIAGSPERFPIRRVFCVGRNYAAHSREMGSDPTREPPFFFFKPADAVVAARDAGGLVLPFPSATANLYYEVEKARVALLCSPSHDRGRTSLRTGNRPHRIHGRQREESMRPPASRRCARHPPDARAPTPAWVD